MEDTIFDLLPEQETETTVFVVNCDTFSDVLDDDDLTKGFIDTLLDYTKKNFNSIIADGIILIRVHLEDYSGMHFAFELISVEQSSEFNKLITYEYCGIIC